MRERIAMLGGTIEVESSPGKGTRIEVAVPMQHCGEERIPEVAIARSESA